MLKFILNQSFVLYYVYYNFATKPLLVSEIYFIAENILVVNIHGCYAVVNAFLLYYSLYARCFSTSIYVIVLLLYSMLFVYCIYNYANIFEARSLFPNFHLRLNYCLFV